MELLPTLRQASRLKLSRRRDAESRVRVAQVQQRKKGDTSLTAPLTLLPTHTA